MKQMVERCRKLLFSTSRKRLLYGFLVVVVAVLLAFFAQKVIFYAADTSAAAYTIQLIEAPERLPEGQPLGVSYAGNTMQLYTDGAVPPADIEVYAATRFGTAALTEENMAQMDETFLGSFAAVYPKQTYDVNGDGKQETVVFSVKTDLREVQSNSAATPLFRDSKIVLEAGMDSCRTLFVYFQSKPLMEREVTVYLADGSSYTTTTDSRGYLESPSLNQIRKGVTLAYAPNGLNTYLCHYAPETYPVFSQAILPLFTLLALAAGSIGFCVLLRSAMNRRAGERDMSLAHKSPRAHTPPFVAVRWAVMLLSFLLLTWAGSWIGLWFETLYLPVLSCSKYNPEQLVGSACYYMSHLNILFTLELSQILVFFACFFLPLFLFGKLFCGFVCPMGFAQEVLHAARQKTAIQGISMTERFYEHLAVIKWTAVLLFLGMGFAGLDFCSICPAVTLSPAFSGFKTTVYISGFVMLFVLVGSFFKRRFFCTICPLGLVMGLVHRLSLVQLKKDCTACTECGACYNACPMGIKRIYTERTQERVTDMNCLLCGECIRNCPEDNALKLTLAGRPLYVSSREAFMKRWAPRGKQKETVTK